MGDVPDDRGAGTDRHDVGTGDGALPRTVAQAKAATTSARATEARGRAAARTRPARARCGCGTGTRGTGGRGSADLPHRASRPRARP